MKPTESNALDSRRIPEWIILYSFFRASQNKELRPATQWAGLGFLVAPTGFGPATSARAGAEVLIHTGHLPELQLMNRFATGAFTNWNQGHQTWVVQDVSLDGATLEQQREREDTKNTSANRGARVYNNPHSPYGFGSVAAQREPRARRCRTSSSL